MELETLITDIQIAFASVTLPRTRMTPHRCLECDELNWSLQGRNRESLNNKTFDEVFFSGAIHLLSPQAIQYYFPRMLERALLLKDETNFFTDILYFLSSNCSHTQSQVSLFTVVQRLAVLDFLLFLKASRRHDFWSYGMESELESAIKIWSILDSPALASLTNRSAQRLARHTPQCGDGGIRQQINDGLQSNWQSFHKFARIKEKIAACVRYTLIPRWSADAVPPSLIGKTQFY